MKTLILFVLILVTTFSIKAQKLIALQSGDNATFYTNLDTALYYAKNGDDIYLPGGYIKANSTTLKIDKAVNIIGVGYDHYLNAATEITIIQSQTIKIMPSVNGGSISGIAAGGSMLQIQDTVSNYSISRCSISSISIGSEFGDIPPSNILITETITLSIFSLDDIPTSPINVMISNCVLGNLETDNIRLSALSGKWNDLTCKNTIISSISNTMLLNIRNSLFENCVFNQGYSQQYYNENVSNNTFRNCLFQNSYSGLHPNFTSNNVFLNGHVVANEIFNSGTYNLKADSPGKNAGKDGTDIGIYGGRYPWKDGGLPINPHIDTFNVDGNTNLNGTLKVSIKVAAQDH